MGIEPMTFSLATRRSTTELYPLINFLLSKTLSLNTNYTLTFRIYLIMEQGTNQDSSVTKTMLPEDKFGLSRLTNQGLSRWQRDALPLSYTRNF